MVIATTGERFSDFAPYVASVNDAGTVAFQAALQGGGTGVFTGSDGGIEEAVGPTLLAGVTSHPDLNNAGAMSFYGDLPAGHGVFLLRYGLQTIADTHGEFASIGPLGPTMNEAGAVAFRADRAAGGSGIFVGDGDGVATVPTCRVPNVVGQRLARARTRIRQAHCSVGRIRRRHSRRVGRVLAQSPRAGTRLSFRGRVSLVVGRR
jgi:PASTA domain-containing protein